MPSALDLLSEWLAEDRERNASVYATGKRQWRCHLNVCNLYYTADRFTPNAAIRAAIEKARKS